MSDSNTAHRFQSRRRPMQAFRVNAVERLTDDSGEAAVRGVVDGRAVEVRYVETSGEFRLHSEDGVEEISRSDLRDLGPALASFQKSVPWTDSITGDLLKAVNEAVFPTTLADLAVRSVSELGRVVLMTGRTSREDIDVVLDTACGELGIMVTSGGHTSPRRPMTTQEAWDLSIVLRARLEGRVVTSQRSLVALIAEAARRRAHH